MNRELYNKLIFELSRPGRRGYQLPDNQLSFENTSGANSPEIPAELLRQSPLSLPECDELTVVRHYNNMSTNNFGVDTGFYPLGSCTMKYNPKINEEIANHPAFSASHPATPDAAVQGNLELYYSLQRALAEIGGMAEFTLNPFAGAHGELTGLMVIRAYHNSRNDLQRRKVIVPDSAHGTNPASAAVAGLEVVEVKSRPDGTIDVNALRPLLDDTVAAMMMTNPNTLGLFETNIPQIAELVHNAGALMYYDGANLNPLLGVARPGDMGFDVMHINLHKTFSTPHGGGGPGAGPVGVRAGLEQFLPNPRVVKNTDADGNVKFSVTTSPSALGSISATLGNFAVQARALAYILSLGASGLMEAGALATLNANYVKESLKNDYLLPIPSVCKHEFVFDGLRNKSKGVTTLHVAKRLLDFGYHAPTIYFPLLFHESLMIEPTESESKETLDKFIQVMHIIAIEARDMPGKVLSAPLCTPISHPDDTAAAINPITTFDALEAAANTPQS
jgi:glycine dehydrogenase subunit 2